MALIREIGVTIHAFDPTPKSIKWVKAQNFPKSFIMHEYGIADFDGIVTFNPRKILITFHIPYFKESKQKIKL